MVEISEHVSKIFLFRRDGALTVYASINDARKALGFTWIAENVGRNFREFSHISNLAGKVAEREVIYCEYQYIMRNDFGETITAKDFYIERISRYRGRYRFWNGTGPVPGTRKWRGGRNYMRRPRTMSEQRCSIPVIEDNEVAPRPARRAKSLPDSWSDFARSDYKIRNWKNYRKNQWKDK